MEVFTGLESYVELSADSHWVRIIEFRQQLQLHPSSYNHLQRISAIDM